ncbi:MAG: hypothetical protein NC402_07395 [Prevotella sp.]|nr:hypothetical protein [Prevotella sp.]MCM1074252.1 hypothetical protein [Ruminococcus sp.]
MRVLSDILNSAGELIWPRNCHVCKQPLPSHTQFVCSLCNSRLPRVPVVESPPILDRFALCRNIVSNHAWLFYGRHEVTADLLQDIKYRGCYRLARRMGYSMAWELGITGVFNAVDAIVPVPLHFTRRLKRGYNQTYEICRGVSQITGLPIINALKARYHKSQTHLSHQRRMSNVEGRYFFNQACKLGIGNPAPTVLLVDDVCTTGSTLLNCAEALAQAIPDIRIRVLTLTRAT